MMFDFFTTKGSKALARYERAMEQQFKQVNNPRCSDEEYRKYTLIAKEAKRELEAETGKLRENERLLIALEEQRGK